MDGKSALMLSGVRSAQVKLHSVRSSCDMLTKRLTRSARLLSCNACVFVLVFLDESGRSANQQLREDFVTAFHPVDILRLSN